MSGTLAQWVGLVQMGRGFRGMDEAWAEWACPHPEEAAYREAPWLGGWSLSQSQARAPVGVACTNGAWPAFSSALLSSDQLSVPQKAAVAPAPEPGPGAPG